MKKRIRVFFIGNQGKKKKLTKKTAFPFMLSLMLLAIILPAVLAINLMPDKTRPYQSILRTARAAPLPVKNLSIFSGKATDFFANSYKLSEFFSIVEDDGMAPDCNLSASQFIGYNTMNRFFNQTALRTISLSKQYGQGKKISVIKKSKNWASAFLPISYKEFYEKSHWPKKPWAHSDHPSLPHLKVNKQLPYKDGQFKIKRIFADNVTRYFVPKEPFLALTPNLYGNFSKEMPSLEPEEVVPIALVTFSGLYSEKKWNEEKLKDFLVKQYALYSGIVLDSENIEIQEKGIRTRFIYNGRLEKNETFVYWHKEEIGASSQKNKLELVRLPVPIVNEQKELCFFSSMDPSQSLIIPLSYLPEIKNDDLLLADNGSVFTFDDVLAEISASKINHEARLIPLYGLEAGIGNLTLSSLVTSTERLRIISNNIIGKAQTHEEALVKLKSFLEQTLPYLTDNKETRWRADISMTTLLTFVNGGGDCEDHAIPYASLYVSADHQSMNGLNNYVGLQQTTFIDKNNESVGHVNPLIPIPGRKPVTMLFPDHIKANIMGREMYFFNIEATGMGEDKIGVTRMQFRAYEPNSFQVITGSGKERIVASAGFSEYQHF